jgi:hypothetical protein
MGIRGDDYWFDVGILILMIVCIRFAAYCALKKMMSGK